jgi:hypothetical protein
MAKKKITDEQLKAELSAGMTSSQIAHKYSVHVRRVQERKAALAVKGFSPEHAMNKELMFGQRLRGTSDMVDKDGNILLRWIKTTADEEKQREAMLAAIEALSEDLPRVKATPKPIFANENLLDLYVITDYHLGMLAWNQESGDDWDVSIAEDLLIRWFRAAIASAPGSKIGILANLGDFLHWDGLDAVTPSSGHVLDADTRFQKLVRVAIRVIRQIIDMLLAKHDHLHVIMAEGNHDMASSIWLREWLSAIYENEPRITVDCNPDPYYCYEFGNTSLFFHHGHKSKQASLDSVLVAKYRDVFGRTKHSYAHCGHLHHVKALETNLMVVEQHRTLAAKDAYASRGGWMSGRDAKVITYHKEHGKVSELVISPSMVA